jgi:hypothetical protein
MKYLVVGWSTKYQEPGFRTEHDTMEAAIAEAHAELADNSHQVTVEVFASTRILMGHKLAWQPNGVLAVPARYQEAKETLQMDAPRLPKAGSVARLRERYAERRQAAELLRKGRRRKSRPLDKPE